MKTGDKVLYGFVSCGDADDNADVKAGGVEKTFVWFIIRLVGTRSWSI